MNFKTIYRQPTLAEKVCVPALLAAIVIVPPLTIECFPLSTCSMFARPYCRFYKYSLTNAIGNPENNDIYGLRTNVNWYLEYTYPVKFPPLAVPPPDTAPNIAKAVDHIRELGTIREAKFPLTLTIEVIGDKDGERAGIVESTSLRIERNTRRDAEF